MVALIEAPRVVTVAVAVVVTVAVAVVVLVTVEELAGVACAGFDAGGVENWGVFEAGVRDAVGGAPLDTGGRVDVLDSVGGEVIGGATVDEGDVVGASVGVPGLDGRLTVGTVTVGPSDLVGVGSPEPPPPVPHPAAVATVISNAATTATRMALPPQAQPRLPRTRLSRPRPIDAPTGPADHDPENSSTKAARPRRVT